MADNATTHTILKDKKYFANLKLVDENFHTIAGHADLIECSGQENITFHEGITFIINEILFSSRSRRNLPSFKDIRRK